MYTYIKGKITEIHNKYIVLEAGGIGYLVFTPSPASFFVSDQEQIVYTLLRVQEDAVTLYGFHTQEERAAFCMLISVSGIGAKSALGILQILPLADLYRAISAGDAKTIASAPGIGVKTARKLVLELADKLPEEIRIADAATTKAAEDAISALISLGFSNLEAQKAVRKAEGKSTEELVKNALKELRSNG